MKIQWLNPDRTRAILTKGWFRKRWAEVYQSQTTFHWYYTTTNQRVDDSLACGLWESRDGKREPRAVQPRRVNPWQPVSTLPQARLVERGGV